MNITAKIEVLRWVDPADAYSFVTGVRVTICMGLNEVYVITADYERNETIIKCSAHYHSRRRARRDSWRRHDPAVNRLVLCLLREDPGTHNSSAKWLAAVEGLVRSIMSLGDARAAREMIVSVQNRTVN